MRFPKILRHFYYKYFAKVNYYTVHLRGSLSGEKKTFFNNHPFRIELKNINRILTSQKNRDKENILEIGFGDGYHLLKLAQLHPDKNFIGVELDEISIYKILFKIDKFKIQNLQIVRADARNFLNKIDSQTFTKIFVPFPDPWPKRREFKRRLINTEFLKNLLNKLEPLGEIIVTTDIDSYKEQIENILLDLMTNKIVNFQKFDEENFTHDKTIFNSKFAIKAKKEGRINTIFVSAKKIS